MAEINPFRHVPDSIKDTIPETCVSCPALLGSLGVHNEFIDAAVRKRKRTWNPIAKVALIVSQKLSEARLYSDMHERVLGMQECAGIIEYPANSDDPAILCGVGVREALTEQVTNQSLRTQ